MRIESVCYESVYVRVLEGVLEGVLECTRGMRGCAYSSKSSPCSDAAAAASASALDERTSELRILRKLRLMLPLPLPLLLVVGG